MMSLFQGDEYHRVMPKDDRRFLFAMTGDGHHTRMSKTRATGKHGIAKALRRLDLILARHGSQPDGTPSEQ